MSLGEKGVNELVCRWGMCDGDGEIGKFSFW